MQKLHITLVALLAVTNAVRAENEVPLLSAPKPAQLSAQDQLCIALAKRLDQDPKKHIDAAAEKLEQEISAQVRYLRESVNNTTQAAIRESTAEYIKRLSELEQTLKQQELARKLAYARHCRALWLLAAAGVAYYGYITEDEPVATARIMALQVAEVANYKLMAAWNNLFAGHESTPTTEKSNTGTEPEIATAESATPHETVVAATTA